MRHMVKVRAALMVVLIGLSAAGLVFGQENDPCRQAYLETGLTAQQMTFDEFRGFYSDAFCANGSNGPVAATGDQVPGETR
jgi:hypothetical protein